MTVIVLALWPGASADEVKTRARNYETEYPGAKIEILAPASIDSSLADYEKSNVQFIDENEGVLIHIFGDDAAARVCAFLRVHYSRTGKAMNVKQLIFDSAPLSFLARTFSKPYQILVSACSWICAPVLQAESLYDDQTWVKQDLESSYLLPASVKRYHVSPMNHVVSDYELDVSMESGLHMKHPAWLTKASHGWKVSDCSISSWTSV